ncbi:MAG: hypothetical protein GF310_10685, partial [candidate division Zixibacteria bacterium]|nr:hypothetical protein [candidate division Zixibacteria bacterium]
MQKNRLLTMILLTLTLLFAFAGFNSALAQDEDTVSVVSVQVDPDPSNPVVFSVPVNLSITGDPNVTNDYIQGASLGHYFDPGTYLTIDSVTLTGGLAENPDFPQANAVDDSNLGVIGFVQFSPTKWIAPDQSGLIGTLWFTLEAGAPDHIVNIDSGFFPPAGNFILTNAGGQTVLPEFNAGTITVGSPAAAELAVSPVALSFNATEGGANPASQSFNISNA